MNSRAGLIVRACRGPILLITIGALFAAQQSGVASFERTWPLLIIALGLMKLLERVFAPQLPYPQPSYGPHYQAPEQTYRPPQGFPPPPPGDLR